MKKKRRAKFTVICICIALAIMMLSLCLANKATAYAQEATAENVGVFGNKQIEEVGYLYNYDDSADYIYIIFVDGGYAVVANRTYEPLEYSLSGQFPFEEINLKKYYGGPNVYLSKENDKFIDVKSKAEIVATEEEIMTKAQQSRAAFSLSTADYDTQTVLENENIFQKLNAKVSQPKSSVPPLDENNFIRPTDGATYLENKEYFLTKWNSPTHGKNNGKSCTTVAVQLMLSYNNYYNDRRIISPEYLNGGWTGAVDNNIYNSDNYAEPENNPNACADPMLKTRYALGSNQAYHDYLFNKGIYEELTKSAKNLKSLQPTYYSVSYKETLGGLTAIDSTSVLAEINQNRPILVSTCSELNGNDGGKEEDRFDHSMLAYGYQEFAPYPNNSTSYLGYIVHMGWDPNGSGNYRNNVWINSAWCYGYISMKVNHTHAYEYVEKESSEPYNEYRCTVCGHRDGLYETNEAGDTITGVKHPIVANFTTIPARINNIPITKLGDKAFYGTDVIFVTFEDYTMVREFGTSVFENCKQLALIRLPDNLVSTGKYTFKDCTALSITYFGESLTTIDDGFLQNSPFTKFDLPASVEMINYGAFANSGLKQCGIPTGYNLSFLGKSAFSGNDNFLSFMLPYSVSTIEAQAFYGCSSLTIYSEQPSQPYEWNDNWNSSNRPVIWGCRFLESDESKYVYIVSKTANSISNANAVNGINNPYRKGYTFGGWYTTSDFSGTQYMDITTAPNGVLYAKWEDSSCVAAGSMITLADGSQKAVEDLTGNEELLVWNLMTGSFDTAPILFIDSEAKAEFDVIKLAFSDGTTVDVISEHAFWDFNLNKYVYLDKNASDYIGHWFNKQTTDISGNLGWTKVRLESVTIQKEYTTAWSPVTYGHLCYYVNGMLSMPGGIGGLFNIFEVDSETMKIKQEEYLADIEEYGIFTYEEFAEILPIPEEIFEAAGCKYFKVAIGKGILSWDKLYSLVERYSKFF